jgi:signal peptidase II
LRKVKFSDCWRRLLQGLPWLVVIIIADFLSKIAALHWISPWRGGVYPYGGIGVFDIPGLQFSLNTVVNRGIAWGVFPGYFSWLLFLRIAAIIILFIYMLFFRSSRSSQIPFWLIAGGALGNVIDMILYGHVIDLFHVRIAGWSFPIFNVADSCITIGALLLILLSTPKKLDLGGG